MGPRRSRSRSVAPIGRPHTRSQAGGRGPSPSCSNHDTGIVPVLQARRQRRIAYIRRGRRFAATPFRAGVTSLANDVAVVDRSADERSGAGTDDRAQGLISPRRDDVAQRATGDAAEHETHGAVVALAVVAVVRAAVDTIVSPQPSRLVSAIVPIVLRGIPVAFARIVAIAAIPPVFVTSPAILVLVLVLGLRERRIQADARCQEQRDTCRFDTVHLDLPSGGHD